MVRSAQVPALSLLLAAAGTASADVPKKGGQTVGAREMVLITVNNGFVRDTAHVGLLDPAGTPGLTREGAVKSANFNKLHVISACPSQHGIQVFGTVTANSQRPPDVVLSVGPAPRRRGATP
jgi:hypothetical protein